MRLVIMRKGSDMFRRRLVVLLRKAEQLGLFGAAVPAGPTKRVRVKGHVRHTEHGATFVEPHERQVALPVASTHDTPPEGGRMEPITPEPAPELAPSAPKATLPPLKDTSRSRYWATRSDADEVAVGAVLLRSDAKNAPEKGLHHDHYVVVTKAGKPQYIREDGLSFGLPADEGWTQDYTIRIATPEEAADSIARRRDASAKADAEKATREGAKASHEQIRADWEAAHPGYVKLTGPPPLKTGSKRLSSWTESSGANYSHLTELVSESGHPVLQDRFGMRDDWRESYTMHPDDADAVVAAWAAEHSIGEDKARAMTGQVYGYDLYRHLVDLIDSDRPLSAPTRALVSESGRAQRDAVAEKQEAIAAAIGGASPTDPLTAAEAQRIYEATRAAGVRATEYHHDSNGPDPIPKGHRPRLYAAEMLARGYQEDAKTGFFHAPARALAGWLSPAGAGQIRSKGALASVGELWRNEAGEEFHTGGRIVHTNNLFGADLEAYKARGARAIQTSAMAPVTRATATAMVERGVPPELETRLKALVDGTASTDEVPLQYGSRMSTLYAPTAAAQQYARAVAPHIESATVETLPAEGRAALTLKAIPEGKAKAVPVGRLVFHEDGTVDSEALGKHAKTFAEIPAHAAAAAELKTAHDALEEVHRTQILTPAHAALIRQHAAALDQGYDDPMSRTLSAITSTYGTHGVNASSTRARSLDIERGLDALKTRYLGSKAEADAAMEELKALVDRHDLPVAGQTEALNEPYMAQFSEAKARVQAALDRFEPRTPAAKSPEPKSPAPKHAPGDFHAVGRYSKLRSGDWGASIPTTGLRRGDMVKVAKRDGTMKLHRIRSIVHTGDDYTLVSIED